MDTISTAMRSKVMAAVRGNGNLSTEMRMVALLRSHGIKGWRRGQKVYGRPDFVFWTGRVAVFVDGDFWHGHPTRCRMPKSNVEFWSAKITSNRRRDRDVTRTLKAAGWRVIRVWESSLAKYPRAVARRISIAIGQNTR
jgi:DNA mismatch endonuclease (patch repair protein)